MSEITILSPPLYGWTTFGLPDVPKTYELSYLTDVSLEWLDNAIYGLENLTPFCVHGVMEPDRMLCTVSFWHCYITVEPEDQECVSQDDLTHYVSDTDMLTFCTALCRNVQNALEAWVHWDLDEDIDFAERRAELTRRLNRLAELLKEQNKHFQAGRGFF